MFNVLRFLTKFPCTLDAMQRPVSLVVCKRSICWGTGRRRRSTTILASKFECADDSYNKRYKRTKKNDEEPDDLEMDDSSKLVRFRTSTMRMDSILKHALGKSRNKIEEAFYESRIRVNGEKVMKKSHTLEVGDEVDLVKGHSPNNPDFLLVSRVEVLSAELDDDELEVKLRKFKNLLINNYDNKWKSSS